MRNFNAKSAVLTVLALHGIAGALYGLGLFWKWQTLLITHSILDKIDGKTCQHALAEHIAKVVLTTTAEIATLFLLLLFGFVIWKGINSLYANIDDWLKSRKEAR